jgi:hypothetical protein
LKIPHKKAFSEAGYVQLTSAEGFWYLIMNILLGYGYLLKVPTRKALSDAGVLAMTEANNVWYIIMCIDVGAGYLAKVPVKKALSEVPQIPPARTGAPPPAIAA